MAKEIQENLDFGDLFGVACVLRRFTTPGTLLKSRGSLRCPGTLGNFLTRQERPIGNPVVMEPCHGQQRQSGQDNKGRKQAQNNPSPGEALSFAP